MPLRVLIERFFEVPNHRPGGQDGQDGQAY